MGAYFYKGKFYNEKTVTYVAETSVSWRCLVGLCVTILCLVWKFSTEAACETSGQIGMILKRPKSVCLGILGHRQESAPYLPKVKFQMDATN